MRSLALQQFQASHFPLTPLSTQEELEKAAHNYELAEADSTVLCIDYAQNGIGSNSCGPAVIDSYRFDEETFQFEFTLVPFLKK